MQGWYNEIDYNHQCDIWFSVVTAHTHPRTEKGLFRDQTNQVSVSECMSRKSSNAAVEQQLLHTGCHNALMPVIISIYI